MDYMIKAGILYDGEEAVARLKGDFYGPEKQILLEDGTEMFRTAIRNRKKEGKRTGDIRYREYVMLDGKGGIHASAKPGYAKDENPDEAGWPVCRVPHADHADLLLEQEPYRLIMENSQSYLVIEASGKAVIRILHNGIAGGWKIQADSRFTPELLCGVFVFCRYLEQENIFLVV